MKIGFTSAIMFDKITDFIKKCFYLFSFIIMDSVKSWIKFDII